MFQVEGRGHWQELLNMVREFSYLVCIRKLTPFFRKIGTKENSEVDFISRCHDPAATEKFYKEKGPNPRKFLGIPERYFKIGLN